LPPGLHSTFVSIHQMAPHLTEVSSYSLLFIYRPGRDERLSWPGWLTYSGRFTHISGHPSSTGKVRWPETDVLLLSHAANLTYMCLYTQYNMLFVFTILVFWHDRVTKSKKSEEHVYVRVACFHRLPQTVVVESKARFIHWVVGKVDSRRALQMTTNQNPPCKGE